MMFNIVGGTPHFTRTDLQGIFRAQNHRPFSSLQISRLRRLSLFQQLPWYKNHIDTPVTPPKATLEIGGVTLQLSPSNNPGKSLQTTSNRVFSYQLLQNCLLGKRHNQGISPILKHTTLPPNSLHQNE